VQRRNPHGLLPEHRPAALRVELHVVPGSDERQRDVLEWFMQFHVLERLSRVRQRVRRQSLREHVRLVVHTVHTARECDGCVRRHQLRFQLQRAVPAMWKRLLRHDVGSSALRSELRDVRAARVGPGASDLHAIELRRDVQARHPQVQRRLPARY
jgi:hypothetical protein